MSLVREGDRVGCQCEGGARVVVLVFVIGCVRIQMRARAPPAESVWTGEEWRAPLDGCMAQRQARADRAARIAAMWGVVCVLC